MPMWLLVTLMVVGAVVQAVCFGLSVVLVMKWAEDNFGRKGRNP